MLGITNLSKVPLRLVTFTGFFCALLSSGGLYYSGYKITFWKHFTVGVAPVVIGLFFLGSVQMIALGIIGEYVGSIHTMAQNRPLVGKKSPSTVDQRGAEDPSIGLGVPAIPAGRRVQHSVGYGVFALLNWTLRPARRLTAGGAPGEPDRHHGGLLGYKWFVFRTRGHYLREWLRCVGVYGTSMVIGLAGMAILVPVLRRHMERPQAAAYVAMALMTSVTVAFSSFGHKTFHSGDAGRAGRELKASNTPDIAQKNLRKMHMCAFQMALRVIHAYVRQTKHFERASAELIPLRHLRRRRRFCWGGRRPSDQVVKELGAAARTARRSPGRRWAVGMKVKKKLCSRLAGLRTELSFLVWPTDRRGTRRISQPDGTEVPRGILVGLRGGDDHGRDDARGDRPGHSSRPLRAIRSHGAAGGGDGSASQPARRDSSRRD